MIESQITRVKQREAMRLAQTLFSVMKRWDSFDHALHVVCEVLAIVKNDKELLRELAKYYCLSELYSSAKHYQCLLNQIIKILEEAME